MRPNCQLILQTISFIFIVFFYCEFLVYYVVLYSCDWPKLNNHAADPSINPGNEPPLKAMVLADTHLLGSRKGHWFDKLRREWQMHRSFQTAVTLHKPDAVFVLGDLFDEGLYCSEVEFQNYVNRFHSLFALPKDIQMYVVVGNHDIGFHYRITPYLSSRFNNAFNQSAVIFFTLKGNHFVLLNSMSLEGDGCFLCKPAEQQITHVERLLKCANGTITEKCDKKYKLDRYSKPILLQHFPMYRESDAQCDGIDAAPYPIKAERFRENWECLSKGATNQLLKQLDPRVVMDGHTHHGCTRPLLAGEGVEYTIPSFSWRNKKNPTFGMAVFTPNNHAFYRCEMPNENTVVNIYMIAGTILMLWIGYTLFIRKSRKKLYKTDKSWIPLSADGNKLK